MFFANVKKNSLFDEILRNEKKIVVTMIASLIHFEIW
jgi:hypothetical protein